MACSSSSSSSNGPKKVFPIFEKNFRPRKPDPLQEIQMTLEKSQQEQYNQAKRRKCLLGKKETPGLTQMVLDAGQKVIGPIHCEECGLLYSPGDIEDEREHRKAHSRLDNLFSIRLWKNANIVLNFPAEACMIISVECKTDSKRVLNSLKDFLAWLDSELAGSDGECGQKPTEKIFLYVVRTKRKDIFQVLGCAIVETIDQTRVASSPLVPASETGHGKMVLGLTRLWTDAAFRKKHIASRLCDAIRISWSIPGMVLPKHGLGILEPSEDGKAFMCKYTNNQGYFYTYTSAEVSSE